MGVFVEYQEMVCQKVGVFVCVWGLIQMQLIVDEVDDFMVFYSEYFLLLIYEK